MIDVALEQVLGEIEAWEQGQLNRKEELALFQELVTSRMVWHLSNNLRVQAQKMIDAGEVKDNRVSIMPSGERPKRFTKGPHARGKSDRHSL